MRNKRISNRNRKRCRCYGGTDVFYGIPVQQMYGSNGASAGLPVGMTTLKGTTGTLGALGTYGSALGGNGCHDPAAAGKLAAPCGPQARAQRGPGPPLLPGKVRSHGSDSDISSSQKDEWFV
ncbi:uncharacterized protein LOC105681631 [Bombus impatiens]|uniref:Uncharacterized protein LOC105681631 n=1 Tax=Bombus impatiens TaxID=132113 RepID=A0A6P8LL97_BOMIM|nr:uncharacterized protein LOC105681631 [Bombus impatiens]